jgi:hypothetical protein
MPAILFRMHISSPQFDSLSADQKIASLYCNPNVRTSYREAAISRRVGYSNRAQSCSEWLVALVLTKETAPRVRYHLTLGTITWFMIKGTCHVGFCTFVPALN